MSMRAAGETRYGLQARTPYNWYIQPAADMFHPPPRLSLGQGHFALRAGWTNSYSVNCTIPSDSTAAIVRARSDNTGPGQRPVAAIIEMCGRLSSRENTLTLRWVPGHLGVEGDETADGWTRSAAENVGGSVVKDNLRDSSFAHMARS